MNTDMKRRIIYLAVAALMIVAGTSTVSAQTPASSDEVVKIEAQAEGYLGDPGKWDRAASLYRQAAEMRAAADPVGVVDLVRAGRLSFYEGDESQAVRDFRNAGQRALAIGDVVSAINAFVDAAWVADRQGDNADAHDYLGRAQLLANSPLLGESERQLLQTRWEVTSQQQ